MTILSIFQRLVVLNYAENALKNKFVTSLNVEFCLASSEIKKSKSTFNPSSNESSDFLTLFEDKDANISGFITISKHFYSSFRSSLLSAGF